MTIFKHGNSTYLLVFLYDMLQPTVPEFAPKESTTAVLVEVGRVQFSATVTRFHKDRHFPELARRIALRKLLDRMWMHNRYPGQAKARELRKSVWAAYWASEDRAYVPGNQVAPPPEPPEPSTSELEQMEKEQAGNHEQAATATVADAATHCPCCPTPAKPVLEIVLNADYGYFAVASPITDFNRKYFRSSELELQGSHPSYYATIMECASAVSTQGYKWTQNGRVIA